MGVVGRGGIRDAAGAADVGMAELVGETLELVCIEVIVVPEDMVVGGAACALGAGKRREVLLPRPSHS